MRAEKAKGSLWSSVFSTGAWSASAADAEETTHIELTVTSDSLESGAALAATESVRVGFFPDEDVKLLEQKDNGDEKVGLDEETERKLVALAPGLPH